MRRNKGWNRDSPLFPCSWAPPSCRNARGKANRWRCRRAARPRRRRWPRWGWPRWCHCRIHARCSAPCRCNSWWSPKQTRAAPGPPLLASCGATQNRPRVPNCRGAGTRRHSPKFCLSLSGLVGCVRTRRSMLLESLTPHSAENGVHTRATSLLQWSCLQHQLSLLSAKRLRTCATRALVEHVHTRGSTGEWRLWRPSSHRPKNAKCDSDTYYNNRRVALECCSESERCAKMQMQIFTTFSVALNSLTFCRVSNLQSYQFFQY